MRIAEGDSTNGFRIGGLPPIGVTTKITTEYTQYFATFPVVGFDGEEFELSLFFHFDYAEGTFIRFEPQDNDSGVFECVIHKLSRRSKKSRYPSEAAARKIIIGNSSDDPVKYGFTHKIGAFPYIENYHYIAQKASADFIANGFLHLMEWRFPGPEDSVDGDWCLGNYYFHLYIKKSDEGYDFRAFLA